MHNNRYYSVCSSSSQFIVLSLQFLTLKSFSRLHSFSMNVHPHPSQIFSIMSSFSQTFCQSMHKCAPLYAHNGKKRTVLPSALTSLLHAHDGRSSSVLVWAWSDFAAWHEYDTHFAEMLENAFNESITTKTVCAIGWLVGFGFFLFVVCLWFVLKKEWFKKYILNERKNEIRIVIHILFVFVRSCILLFIFC